MKNDSNEMRVLKEFCQEFNPVYTAEMLSEMDYNELVSIVKDIADEL